MDAWTTAKGSSLRNTKALLGSLALALAACDEPAPRFDAPLVSGVVTLPMLETQRFDVQLSAPGLLAALQGAHRDIVVDSAGDAQLIVAHLPHDVFEATILGLGVVALDALRDQGYALALGSGFVSVFNPVSPLGLLQLDGEVKSEPTPHGYTRILGSEFGRLQVIGRADYHPGLFEAAIQVGPGIVQRGKLDILQRERELPAYTRAVAVTCEDRWLAAIAQTPMHLYDVGGRLLAYFQSNALRCDEAVNLSGDREALLAIRSDDGTSIAYFGDPTLPKASVIAFRMRRLQPATASQLASERAIRHREHGAGWDRQESVPVVNDLLETNH